MLSARAYSFRQKARLAISLSWIGGFTNTVGFLSCGAVVSHVSGTVTSFGSAIARGQSRELVFFGFVVFAFAFGAAASAVMTEGARRHGRRSKYAAPLIVEALLLTSVSISLNYHGHVDAFDSWMYWTTGALSFGMGLQNATITRISGAVVRTTHLTGVVTDLGLEGAQLVMWYRDRLGRKPWRRVRRVFKVSTRHPSFERVLVLSSIASSFFFGALIGTWAWFAVGSLSMLAPVAGLAWVVYLDWRQPIAYVQELDPAADAELARRGLTQLRPSPALGIYRCTGRTIDAAHRAPDFQLWVEQLLPQRRIVILVASPFMRFDHNAALDLHEAARKLRSQNRTLILCGVTPQQLEVLDVLGIGDIVEAPNVCPDIESALARGLTLLRESEAPARTAPRRVSAS